MKMKKPFMFFLILALSSIQCSHGLSRESFPKGFLFGTATSAYQVEGMASKEGRGPSIWDVFIKTPGLEPNNATGEVSVDQYHRYKEDIDLMKNLNFDAYRFSISWSRIFPNGTGKVNQKGVAYYNRLIDYMLKRGITPYANLNHYDLPQALQEKYNGWLGHEVVNDFADYADFCFKAFGDRVKNWMTFNEPRVVAALGYDTSFFAPGRCSKTYGNCTAGNSATEPYIVAHNLIFCHASAVQRYRTKYQKLQKGRIGILLDFVWYEPLTRSKADNLAAQRARDFHVGWFLHPIVYGEYPKTMQNILGKRLPKFTKEEVDMVKRSFDVVGINQYTAYYIYNPNPTNKPKELSYQQDWNAGFAYARQGVPIGPTIATTLTLVDLVPSTKTIASFKLPDYNSGKLEVQYFHHHATFTTAVALNQKTLAIDFSATAGNPTFAIGTEAGYETSSGKLTKYTAGISITKPDACASIIL